MKAAVSPIIGRRRKQLEELIAVGPGRGARACERRNWPQKPARGGRGVGSRSALRGLECGGAGRGGGGDVGRGRRGGEGPFPRPPGSAAGARGWAARPKASPAAAAVAPSAAAAACAAAQQSWQGVDVQGGFMMGPPGSRGGGEEDEEERERERESKPCTSSAHWHWQGKLVALGATPVLRSRSVWLLSFKRAWALAASLTRRSSRNRTRRRRRRGRTRRRGRRRRRGDGEEEAEEQEGGGGRRRRNE